LSTEAGALIPDKVQDVKSPVSKPPFTTRLGDCACVADSMTNNSKNKNRSAVLLAYIFDCLSVFSSGVAPTAENENKEGVLKFIKLQ
jgi:hypothetical protein